MRTRGETQTSASISPRREIDFDHFAVLDPHFLGIASMDFDEVLPMLLDHWSRITASLRCRVVVIEHASGRQNQRKIVIRQFIARSIINGLKFRFAVQRAIHMQCRRARMICIRTRPLQSFDVFFQSFDGKSRRLLVSRLPFHRKFPPDPG